MEKYGVLHLDSIQRLACRAISASAGVSCFDLLLQFIVQITVVCSAYTLSIPAFFVSFNQYTQSLVK